MYGKRKFHKSRRHFRKTYRSRKAGKRHFRASKGRGLLGFRRKLNAVTEKKMFSATLNSADINARTSVAALGGGNIGAMMNAMTLGANSGQFIGSNIFLRYMIIRITLTNVDVTHYCAGKIGILFIKEREHGICNSLTIRQITGGVAGGLQFGIEPMLLKTHIKRIRLKVKTMQGPSGVMPTGAYQYPDPFYQANGPRTIVLNYKIRIMKTVKIVAAGILPGDIPDFWIIPFYYENPQCLVAAHPTQMQQQLTCTYNDN